MNRHNGGKEDSIFCRVTESNLAPEMKGTRPAAPTSLSPNFCELRITGAIQLFD